MTGLNEDHFCGDLCVNRLHRSEETYRIGGLADYVDSLKIVADALKDAGIPVGIAEDWSKAIIARLAGAEPPLLVNRLYEVDESQDG